MYPEDRVLIGVINRKHDLEMVRDEHWYRIPRDRAPRSIDAEYIAFYLSGYFKAGQAGIHYYARRTGHELLRRIDLLPDQPDHKRANLLYYKLQLDELKAVEPPILNPTHRAIAFIYTTWDRFKAAKTIADLYSKSDWFVERLCFELRRIGIDPQQIWEDEARGRHAAELRILCEKGILVAVANAPEGWQSDEDEKSIPLKFGTDESDISEGVAAVRVAVEALGGAKFVNIPLDE